MNERIARIRARALRSYGVHDPERDALRKESFAQTEGEPTVIREAKAWAHYRRNQTLVILEDELIVGGHIGIAYDPEKDSVPEIFGRQGFKCFWNVSDEVQKYFNEGMLSGAGNHTTMDYATIFEIGFEGLIQRIRNRAARLQQDEHDLLEKRDFLAALEIMAEGYIALCDRYADYAAELAAETIDETRRAELETISRNCRRVPAKPPTTFWEACQAAWFCFFFLADAPGRVDQYLYPFYRSDLEKGLITPDFARELLSCLWVKYFELAGARGAVSAFHHLTLGGVHADGSDASNDVTMLCLDVTEDLRLNRPQIGVRWNRNMPREVLRRAVRVLRTHCGNPDFCNDEQIVPALVRTGIRIEDARDFSLSGCHEVIVTGKAQMGSVEGFINLPKVLRLMLGLEPNLGPGANLAAITDEETLWAAFEEAMDAVAERAHQASLARDIAAAKEPGGNLHASLVVNDCIENVRGYTQGGARYNHCNWDVVGIANVTDSIATIRSLVFENGELTLQELADIVRDNWQGHEALRQRVLNRCPHFGNDDEAVDRIAVRIIRTMSDIMKRRKPFRGGEYILGTLAGGENMHVEFGRMTGATPDGRLSGNTFADSIGPVHGRDRRGVTAMLNSVAKLPHALLPTAVSLNIKLNPELIADERGVNNVAALIEGHFLAGGQQCQFNMVTREMLEDARENPEKYRGLMVRVAGYSAPFTSLWADLQEEIIARTEHTC
ncbi:MAG TPA: pyruvate formate lyase family protein [Candidatus Latescibacteria bacterium]|nr:pyruvate formate lyase family protein [Candidatus Latescibacterota bacterium]